MVTYVAREDKLKESLIIFIYFFNFLWSEMYFE